ncbi:MAG: histidine--tRNA ligase [Sedimentisphaerales bacterium]|nr:histidine--tRNA ligase [Sedimentisphaerales bacterium]
MAKIAPVKGTRDFYPDRMAVRNWIIEGWRRASRRNGFVEYDGPIFEYLQLYTQKSGEEIAGQLFSLTDRGGRDLAIRPEITPTLARMVNQQINALARPIKWFSVPRLCRAERPQKGRLREFFQWNIDVIGEESDIADAECIYTAVDYLRGTGLKAGDIVVKISSRSMLAALLQRIGFKECTWDVVYSLLDKRPKLPEETFSALAAEKIPDKELREGLFRLIDNAVSLEQLATVFDEHQAVVLKEFFQRLETMGVSAFCEFDINIVRGLAYYTGIVYEIFDRKQPLRALCGGGRYDNLLEGLGGPKVPATGFGMGDVVLEIMLQERGFLKAQTNPVDVFVIDADAGLFDKVLEIASTLRAAGFTAVFSYKRTWLGKQLKQASEQNARFAVIVGAETEGRGEIILKDLTAGTQQTIQLADFLAQTTRYLQGTSSTD